MATFSRFGKAFGELGAHLKGNAFISAWKQQGAAGAGTRVLADMVDSGLNWAAHHPDKDGIVRISSLRTQLQHPGTIGSVAGAVAGAGITSARNRRDGGHRSLRKGASLGLLAGYGAGLGYMTTRYNQAGGIFGNLRKAPGAFMSGWRG